MRIKKLLEPLKIGTIDIKNRIAMAPMNNVSQTDPVDGSITKRCVDYYIERAKGGVGLIITGVFKVENEIEKCMDLKTGLVGFGGWPLILKKSMHDYVELANYVHSYGAKIFMQLSAGPGRVTAPDVIISGVKPVSASANECFYVPSETCRPLETDEVEEIVEKFGQAAELVANAGIDGIEVHGHEGYLIDQFSTSLWNKRTDKYGGDTKGRLTFAIEILRKIKEMVGSNFPVTYRYGVKHFIKAPWKSALNLKEKELGRDITESIEIARILEQAGYDSLHLDTGCYESLYWAHPPYYFPRGFSIELTKEVKKAVKIPIMAANRLGLPEIAERALLEKSTDMVVLGRDLLADPNWCNKVYKGEINDIRLCIGCHEGCANRPLGKGDFLSCSINPSCGRENEVHIDIAKDKKRIMVIGGGIGGMECSRIAKTRGHDVVLYEKRDVLGGLLIEASIPDFKEDMRRLLDWYKLQIEKQRIEVKYNTEATIESVKKIEPDVVVLATGSFPFIPDIPGIKQDRTVTCSDLLCEKKNVGEGVVFIGGGMVGCETALWLSQNHSNRKITIVEILPNIANDLFVSNRQMLLDLLENNNVQIMVNTNIKEIKDDTLFMLDNNSDKKQIKADTIVISAGMISNQLLYSTLMEELDKLKIQLFLIGDAKKPRKIHDAIWEGWNVGRTL